MSLSFHNVLLVQIMLIIYFPNVVFTAGLPSLDDLQAMPQYSTIVLDDLFEDNGNIVKVDTTDPFWEDF